MGKLILTNDDIVQILANGGGLRIETAGKKTDDLLNFAANARNGHALLTLVVNSTLRSQDLITIAHGRGSVEFILVDD